MQMREERTLCFTPAMIRRSRGEILNKDHQHFFAADEDQEETDELENDEDFLNLDELFTLKYPIKKRKSKKANTTNN